MARKISLQSCFEAQDNLRTRYPTKIQSIEDANTGYTPTIEEGVDPNVKVLLSLADVEEEDDLESGADQKQLLVVNPSLVGRLSVLPQLIDGRDPHPDERPGWLGKVIQHGQLVTNCMIQYVWYRAKYEDRMCTQPHRGINTAGIGTKTFKAGPSGISTNRPYYYDNHALWTNRFAEWPSPIFPMWRFGFHKGDIWKPGSFILNTIEFMYNKGKIRKRCQDQYIDNAYDKFAYRTPRKIKFPSWWKEDSEKEAKLESRMMGSFRMAHWTVWAMEMIRIHTDPLDFLLKAANKDLYEAWQRHVRGWGIGNHSATRLRKKWNMRTHQEKWLSWWDKDKKKNKWMSGADTGWNVVDLVQVIPWVMRHTPLLTDSDEITKWKFPRPGEGARMLMDMPSSVGSIKPDFHYINSDFYRTLIARWQAEGGSDNSATRMTSAVLAVIETVITVASEGTMSAIALGTLAVFQSLLQMAMNDAFGQGKLTLSDIGKLASDVLTAVAKETNFSVPGLSGTPILNGLGQMANAAKETTESDSFKELVSGLDSLVKNRDWPYINQCFSALFDVGELFGK